MTKPSPYFGNMTSDVVTVGLPSNTSQNFINSNTSGENEYDVRLAFSGGKVSSNTNNNFNVVYGVLAGQTSCLINGDITIPEGQNAVFSYGSYNLPITSLVVNSQVLTTINISNALSQNIAAFSTISIFNQTSQQSATYPLAYSANSGATSIIVVGNITISQDIVYTISVSGGSGIPANTIINSVSYSTTNYTSVTLGQELVSSLTQGQLITITLTDPNLNGYGTMDVEFSNLNLNGNGESNLNINTDSIKSSADVDFSGSPRVLVPSINSNSDTNSSVPLSYLTDNYASQTYVETQVNNIVSAVSACSYPSLPPEKRVPGAYDDSTKGYQVGDYWYFNNTLWIATSVTPNSGTWSEVSINQKPGDVFGNNTIFAGGPSQLVTGYSGPCIDIMTTKTVDVGSTPTVTTPTTTINILANGTFDIDTFLSTIQSIDDGTYIVVTKVYDQTGNGNHLTTTSSNAVHIGVIYINGIPAISWGYRNGQDSYSDQTYVGAGGFSFPSSMQISASNFFFGTLGQNVLCNAGNVSSCPVVFGDTWNNEVKFLTGYYEMDGYMHVLQDNQSENLLELTIHSEPSPFCFYTTASGYGATSLTDSATCSATLKTGTVNGGYVGYNATYDQNNTETGANYYTTSVNSGTYTGIVVANVTPSSSQITSFVQSGIVYGKYTPQSRNQIVVVGDSRSAGYQTFDNNPWPSILQKYQSSKLFNFSVSGNTAAGYLKYLPAISKLRMYSSNIAIVWGGINDISNGDTPASVIVNIQNIVKELQSYGFIVYVISEMENNNHATVIRGPLENAMANGVIPFDGWIDPFNQGNILNETSSSDNFYVDHTHPTNKAHRVLASQIWHEIKSNLV